MTDVSTRMTQEWIERVLKSHPCMVLPNGNIRTCIARMSFPNIFKKSKPIPPNTEGKYGTNLVFPLQADLAVLKKAAADCAKAKWPTAGTPQSPKLKSPFKPQGEMAAKYAGYTDGGIFISTVADRQPPFVMQNQAPITDEAKAYAGAWVIAALNPFAYDKGVNKGVSFGLQGLMFICDDVQLGGGGIDPNVAFAGVSIDSDFNPSDAFGAAGHTAGEQAPTAEVDLFS